MLEASSEIVLLYRYCIVLFLSSRNGFCHQISLYGMLSNPYPSLMIDNGLLCTEGSRVLVGLMDDIMTTCFCLAFV